MLAYVIYSSSFYTTSQAVRIRTVYQFYVSDANLYYKIYMSDAYRFSKMYVSGAI